jgi:hypothetical protein
MNHLHHLYNQVRKAILAEATMDKEDRLLHSWQFLVQLKGVNYVVGKTGYNTMFYRIGDKGDTVTGYPDDILKVILSWTKEKYTGYIIYDGTEIRRKSKSIESLLERTAKKDYVIFGVRPDNTWSALYEANNSLKGYRWVKVKAPASDVKVKKTKSKTKH